MNKEEYLKKILELLDSGKITEEIYDSMIININEFYEN